MKRPTSELAVGNNTLEYFNALGTNEINWVESYAKPRMNYRRSTERPESPDDFLSLLTRYMQLAPYLAPPTSRSTNVRTLSHPDLHLDNIFVNPTTKEITHIIDWQSASVSEIFLQRGVPPLIPRSANDGSDEAMEGGLKCDGANNRDLRPGLMRHYERLTRTSNPRRWEALKDDRISALTKPASLICGAWDRADVFSFRHALINIVARWETLFPENRPCPVHFTDSELELHGEEMELLEGLGTIMRELEAANMIPLGGMVRPENYEHAQYVNNFFKEEFISLADNEHQKALHSKVWPYQDV